MMRIGVVEWITPNQTKYLELTKDNKEQYCKQHGYDFIICQDSMQELKSNVLDFGNKAPFWYKFLALLKYNTQYDYLLWMDSDTIIMNPNIAIESIIDDTHALYISGFANWEVGDQGTHINYYGINARQLTTGSGCFLIKCGPIIDNIIRALSFDESYAIYNIKRPHEEGALQEFINTDRHIHFKRYVKYCDVGTFQSWLPVPILDQSTLMDTCVIEDTKSFKYLKPNTRYRFKPYYKMYAPGDFLLHVSFPAVDIEKYPFCKYVLEHIEEFK